MMSFEQIITEIQKRPVLWMSSNPNYKYRAVKSKLWEELEMKFGVEVDILKKRWKHLKDQYRKELKKKPESKPGSEPNWYSSWKYFESMEFIKDELLRTPSSGPNLSPIKFDGSRHYTFKMPITDQSTDSEIDMLVSSPESEQSSEHPTPHQATNKRNLDDKSDNKDGRKMIKLMEKLVEESSQEDHLINDADYLFLRSLLPSVKKLTDYQKLRFRGKINDWLLEELAPTLNE